MNVLNLYTKAYAGLHNYPGVPYWVLTPLRKMVRGTANKVLPRYLSKHREPRGKTEDGIILSFTSFPARINDVWKVVESLKNQSVLPEKIILWLSKEQFPRKETIPESLWKEVDPLFEICMVEDDIRSHKKFYYVMQKYPDKAFVTCDDDIYYHPDTIKYLVEASKLHPGCIIANISRKMAWNNHGILLPYKQWESVVNDNCSKNIIQIGVGGVLYPPNSLHELTLRKDLFLTLTPMADDIWLNCMARLQGTRVVQSAMHMMPLPIKNDSPSLKTTNRGENGNDRQIAKLREYLRLHSLIDVYSKTENYNESLPIS